MKMRLVYNNLIYILCLLISISKYIDCESDDTDTEGVSDTPLKQSLVIDLEDSNFEKKTQASTGGTSGIWFVKFYAPWCGHCRAMEDDWNELANILDNKINVAKIDATKHTSTSKRFGITSFPTLLLLKDGSYYQYENSNRSVNALRQFALHGYKQVNSKPVPREWTFVDRFKMFIKSGFYEATRIRQLAFPGFVTISFISFIFGFLFGGAGVIGYVYWLDKNIIKKAVKAD